MAVTAAMAHTWVALVALVGVAGLANAWAQPAANLYIARGVQAQRQGLAFGIQKSGIPAASLIAGLSVPAIGLTIGWNWAFVLGALLAFAVSLSVPTVQINSATTAATSNTSAARVQASAGTSTKSPGEAATGETVTSSSANTQVSNHQIRKQTSKPRPDVPVRLLILVGTSTCLAAMGSMALSAFFVLYSVETGVGEGTAGLLLMVGSVVGVASRLVMGASADRGRMSPWQMLTTMFVVAAVAFLGMSTGSMTMLFAAMPFAFATSFAWPGLFHLAMVRSNPSAPGAATGITMTGSFVGAVCGPMVFGSLVESLGYGWAWGFATCTSGAAATVMALVSPRIMRRSSLRS